MSFSLWIMQINVKMVFNLQFLQRFCCSKEVLQTRIDNTLALLTVHTNRICFSNLIFRAFCKCWKLIFCSYNVVNRQWTVSTLVAIVMKRRQESTESSCQGGKLEILPPMIISLRHMSEHKRQKNFTYLFKYWVQNQWLIHSFFYHYLVNRIVSYIKEIVSEHLCIGTHIVWCEIPNFLF